MKQKIINVEQSAYWNEKSGPKWVKNEDALNERLSILTKELFSRANIKKSDKVLDIGCGGGDTTFRVSKLLTDEGHVVGADISHTLLNHAKSKFSNNDSIKFASAGGITLDANNTGATGVINLDAQYFGFVSLKDGGTTYGTFNAVSNHLNIQSSISDADIVLKGNDGGATITALTLDMSAAGAASASPSFLALKPHPRGLAAPTEA